VNLISRQDEANVLAYHILHSLTLRMPAFCDFDFANKRVADVGTGGGLPGIPLKIVTPLADVTLIDSIQKKVAACNAMISTLSLSGIRAIVGRAEDLASEPEHAHAYDVIISRAVASLEHLAKWTQPLLKPNGTLFSFKGGEIGEEIKRARRMTAVRGVQETLLSLAECPDFANNNKKLVRVDFA
jgi:16S rRNA (guanine527-N7)-methyltransferase